MKKLLAVILLLALLLPVASLADLPDLSGLSFDELLQLREQALFAMWNSEQWQEVRVPAGAYEIGVDIPEGYWTMTPNSGDDEFYVYCDQLNETKSSFGDDCDVWDSYMVNCARSLKNEWKNNSALHELSLDLKSGRFLIIPCETVFTPYTGKPDLGFK